MGKTIIPLADIAAYLDLLKRITYREMEAQRDLNKSRTVSDVVQSVFKDLWKNQEHQPQVQAGATLKPMPAQFADSKPRVGMRAAKARYDLV